MFPTSLAVIPLTSVDERRLTQHGERFADLRDLQRERDIRVLTDQELDFREHDGREARKLGLHLVVAGGDVQQPVLALDVRDRTELAAGVEIHRRHRHARKNRLRLVGDRADNGNVLRARGRGAAQQQHGNEQRPD